MSKERINELEASIPNATGTFKKEGNAAETIKGIESRVRN